MKKIILSCMLGLSLIFTGVMFCGCQPYMDGGQIILPADKEEDKNDGNISKPDPTPQPPTEEIVIDQDFIDCINAIVGKLLSLEYFDSATDFKGQVNDNKLTITGEASRELGLIEFGEITMLLNQILTDKFEQPNIELEENTLIITIIKSC